MHTLARVLYESSMHTLEYEFVSIHSSRVCILASRSTSHSSVRACTNTLVVVVHTYMHNKIRDITLVLLRVLIIYYFFIIMCVHNTLLTYTVKKASSPLVSFTPS